MQLEHIYKTLCKSMLSTDKRNILELIRPQSYNWPLFIEKFIVKYMYLNHAGILGEYFTIFAKSEKPTSHFINSFSAQQTLG